MDVDGTGWGRSPDAMILAQECDGQLPWQDDSPGVVALGGRSGFPIVATSDGGAGSCCSRYKMFLGI